MPVFFAITIVFCIWLGYKIHKSDQNDEKTSHSFWKREQESMFIRKQSLDTLTKITVPLSLPFNENASSDIAKIQTEIQSLSNQDIINLTGHTNTDLRFLYGASNLPYLSECDGNFTKLSVLIARWGNLLYASNQTSNARTVFEFGVSIQADIQSIYLNLAELYKNSGELERIPDLLKNAQNIPSENGKIIVQKLKAFIESSQILI